MFDQRELAAVLAALRFWRHRLREFLDDDERALLEEIATEEIATEAGTVEPLTPKEADQLCQRLNANPPRV